MDLGEKIKGRRLDLELTLQEVADIVGVSKSTVQKWESGNIENMRRDKIALLAKALNVSPLFIMGIEQNDTNNVPNKIPLIGTIAAGVPILAEQNIERYFHLDSSVKADFALKIKGDSMVNAGIHEDDIVFIRIQPNVESGEIGAVQIQDIECEATLKRVYKDNGSITLVSENPKYPPKILTSGNVRILGKLVAVLSMKE